MEKNSEANEYSRSDEPDLIDIDQSSLRSINSRHSDSHLRPIGYYQDVPKPLREVLVVDAPTLSVDGKPLSYEQLLKLNSEDLTKEYSVPIDAVASRLEGLANDEFPLALRILAGNQTIAQQSFASQALWQEFSMKQKTLLIDKNEFASLKNVGEVPFFIEVSGARETRLLKSQISVLKIDTIGPRLQAVEFVGSSVSGPQLYLEFTEDTLDPTTVDSSFFKVERLEGRVTSPVTATSATLTSYIMLGRQRQVVKLQFAGELPDGQYRVTVVAQPQANDAGAKGPLSDLSGNYVGGSLRNGERQQALFGISLHAETGPQVQYPEFQPTLPQPTTERRINAGDRVVTTVVRLFYFRDAHRIAQIVNRNVQSYNKAAVTIAEQRAENAKNRADDAEDERQRNEREAIRLAEDLRRLEARIEDLQERLANAQQAESSRREQVSDIKGDQLFQNQRHASIKTQIEVVDERITFLNAQTPVDPIQHANELTALRDRRAELVLAQEESERILSAIERNLSEAERLRGLIENDVKALAEQEQAARDDLSTVRALAQRANEDAIQAQDVEDRARENQYLLETAAANADPDTYAPGRLDSFDPVAQVSVSVIGEGLIQLRGPRKGIDAIRTMIHQMDAPVGQVKAEIVTVQINGERADHMEQPLGKIEAHLALGNFLTSQSLMLLRYCIQEEAARIAAEKQGGHYQLDRDRRYLYAFFGRDFIDELYAMESEFLFSENKILGLHSMDSMSLHQALFILALAKNDVRQNILQRFMERVRGDLVTAEFNFRRSAELFPHRTRWRLPHTDRETREQIAFDGVQTNNLQRYHFSNTMTFFGRFDCNAAYEDSDTMNPMQREFIRLAQIFKARLIAELELKQRIIERTMIESNRLQEIAAEEEALNFIRPQVLELTRQIQGERLRFSDTLASSSADGWIAYFEFINSTAEASKKLREFDSASSRIAEIKAQLTSLQPNQKLEANAVKDLYNEIGSFQKIISQFDPEIRVPLRDGEPGQTMSLRSNIDRIGTAQNTLLSLTNNLDEKTKTKIKETDALELSGALSTIEDTRIYLGETVATNLAQTQSIRVKYLQFLERSGQQPFDFASVAEAYEFLTFEIKQLRPSESSERLLNSVNEIFQAAVGTNRVAVQLHNTEQLLAETRSTLERRKLLDFLIEEQEERLIDLLEGTRAQIATIDNYLKRLSIAMEDDFAIQFFDPAFVQIRDAARDWDVQLGQVERTSILTNNRALAKVTPQATMEYDLPQRNIAIVEALDGARALAEDYGALLQDPTFLAAFQMMGGAIPTGTVQSVLPGLPTSTDEEIMGYSSGPQRRAGAALEDLIPDPSIYKFETGTGYEIRPVIQPDGNSIIYDFQYMYTTEVREPVRADEKHLGRVRRHYIHNQVQTSSFEMRELSRYQVALRASRTSQGVPLLQDIPAVGAIFRPLPSDESSIQQNIVLGRSVVYPTLYDLMGLRWAPSVVELAHNDLRDQEHVTRGRHRNVTDAVFDFTSESVDDILGIEHDSPEHLRRDLYHRQRHPSRYHPGGHVGPAYPEDPTGRNYIRNDRRPPEMREPPMDPFTGSIQRGDVFYDPQMGNNSSTAHGFEYYDPRPFMDERMDVPDIGGWQSNQKQNRYPTRKPGPENQHPPSPTGILPSQTPHEDSEEIQLPDKNQAIMLLDPRAMHSEQSRRRSN